MADRLTFTRKQVTTTKETWVRTDLLCPKCGAREVWREAKPKAPDGIGELFRISFGDSSCPHACAMCAASFQLSFIDPAEGRYRVLEQIRLKGLLKLNDEERSALHARLANRGVPGK